MASNSSNFTTSSSQPSKRTTSSTTTFTSSLNTGTESEFKLEEVSGIETSVPTDLTLSPDTDFSRFPRSRPTSVSKQLFERKQLIHDLQLLKIELSQKNLIIENVKADFMSRTEDLEEKLAEAVHAREITQAMLEAKLGIQEDEMRQKLEESKLEVSRLLKNQKELEENIARLMDKSSTDRRMLYNLEINQENYLDLQKKDPNHLTFKEHIAIKIYEILWPYKLELDATKSKVGSLNEANKMLRTENEHISQVLDAESKKSLHYQNKAKDQENALKDLESRLKTDDFKINNYEQVKKERDKYMENVYEFNKKMSVMEADNGALRNENKNLKEENSTMQQKISMLQQDKDYLSKRMQEISSQNNILDDQVAKVNLQLEKITAAREEIYERYVSARDMYKSEFDRKLKEELDMIQNKTWSEIELLRRTAKEVYEQEIKSLKNARDVAISEKLTAETASKQNMDKCEKFLEEIHLLKGGGDSEILNLRNQLLVKGFEVEQLKMVSAESQRNYKECQLENEKLLKKIEIFENEFKQVESGSGKRINQLESQLSLASLKLTSYEALEKDLDEAVMEAAEAAGDDGQQIVTSFGDIACITTSVKRRLQHSFQLAKRILILEKLNSQLKQQIVSEQRATADLSEEVDNFKRLVNDSNKPNSYLIETIRSRDKLIKQHKDRIQELEQELQMMKVEKEQLRKRIELLTVDLQNLLKNREEIIKMKKLLTSFFPEFALNRVESSTKSPVSPQKKILPRGKPVGMKSPFR